MILLTLFLLGDLYWHLGNRVSPAAVILQSGWVALTSGAYSAVGPLLLPSSSGQVLSLSFRDGEPLATPASGRSTSMPGIGRLTIFHESGHRLAVLSQASRVNLASTSQDGKVQVFSDFNASNLYIVGPTGAEAAPLLSGDEAGISRSAIMQQAAARKAAGTLPPGWHLIWATSPVVSPDGSYVLYLSSRGDPFGSNGPELWRLDLATGSDRELVPASAAPAMTPLGFSPQGFVVGAGNGDVYVINPSDGSTNVLFHNVDVVALSPTGNSLAYVQAQSGQERLMITNLATTRTFNVPLPRFTRFSGQAAFSPDGTKIALLTLGRSGQTELTTATLSNAGVLRETTLPAPSGQALVLDLEPTWVDGDHVAVVTRANGQLRTWTLDLRAGPRTT